MADVNQNPIIDFKLTLADTNMILQALAQRPYFEVANLIHEMQRVAHAKVTPPIGVEVQNGSGETATL